MQSAAHVLVDAPDWPEVDLEVRYLDAPISDASSDWDAVGMRVPLAAGGYLSIVWPLAVTLSLPGHPTPECIVQPHLTTAAASIAMRRGLQPFHAGAFEQDGRAWVILGARESGKSSTLALASREGSPVITDDLLVTEEAVALAGPRCVDLRLEAATALEMGVDLGTVGLRERWRVRVGPCPPRVPLAGFIVPSWGADQLIDLSPVARLQVLFSHSALQGITMNDPDRYLELASLPMLSWARPKSWSSAQRSFDLLRRMLAKA
jgi:hypothetical protein